MTAPAATVELYEFTTLGCDPSTAEAVRAKGLPSGKVVETFAVK